MQRAQSRGQWSAPKLLRTFVAFGAAALALVSQAPGTQDAVANGDTRSLTLFHTHTKESVTVTFRRNGTYDAGALKQLNWFLRDWRTNEPTQMDPQLFDIVWAVYRDVGADVPIHIISAYRSPETNGMLHRRSRGVAERSQHMLGKAMDISLPGIDMNRVRAAGMRLQHGGVGFYGSSGFVHLDVAGVRAWPRMTRTQLARLFPDGKTVHLPSDGKPLSGYEEAKAELLARRGNVAGSLSIVAEKDTGSARRSLWASLFSRGEGWNSGTSQVSAYARMIARAEEDMTKGGLPTPPNQPEQARSSGGEQKRFQSSVASDMKAVLRALFASARVSEPASPGRIVRVMMSRTKPVSVQASLLTGGLGPQFNLRLSESPSFDLSPASFSGPAVKPLPVLVAQGS
jgi:uncharacterized protein YcbK (DUF882 family)